MKLFEIFESSTTKSVDNLSKLAASVKNNSAAKLQVGESTFTLSATSAKYLYELYDIARAAGNADCFMKMLAEGSGPLVENVETLSHIVDRFKHEVNNFMSGADMSEDLYHALFDYYSMHGEMPYGVAKARDGDPYEWVTNRFDQDVYDYMDKEPELPESMYSDADLFSLGESKKMKEGWDDMIKANRERQKKEKEEKGATGKFDKKTVSTGTVYTRKYDSKTGEVEEPKTASDGGEVEKRGRGRPRTRPEPDANAPKRGRGRPRTRPEPDANAPKRGRGRPKKVREWIESLRHIAENKK